MRADYLHNRFQYDVWHIAKSVLKQLTQKENSVNNPAYCIYNHLWWAVQTFIGITTLLDNVHEWNGGEGSVFNNWLHLLNNSAVRNGCGPGG